MRRFNQLIGAFGNMPAIYEGIKNRIFKSEDVEQIAAIRWSICQECPKLDTQGKTCTIPGTGPCCSLCGCSMKTKTRSLISACPDKKWARFLDTKEEIDALYNSFK